ncbi:NAD(P)H-binding protein [Salinicoccus sp. Marseille-QA3877]
MKVFVYGGSERLGDHILKQLDEKGHEAVTVAETDNRAEALGQIGTTEVIIEGKDSFTKALDDVDAIIYIAGASPGTGDDQDALVDADTVVKSLEEAEQQGIERIVYLSPVHLDESDESKKTGGKDQPEEWIKESGFDYTVIRSVKRVSKPGHGKIDITDSADEDNDEIPYEDVAAVLVEALDNKNTLKKTFGMTKGKTSIKEALKDL